MILSLALLSCHDWLDIKPESSVSAEELFSTEDGFFEALNGVYIRSVDNNLYGGIFSVEIPDALAQNYSYNVQDYTNYVKTANFDFTDPTFKWRNELIWSNAYNAIVNTNLILEHIDEKKDLFHEGMYELVKGEALALRAYLHFDLLRYFAQPYSTGASSPAIPYVTSYSNRVTPLSTVEEVAELVLKDLNEAKKLLKDNDPITQSDYIVGYNTDDPEESTEMANANLFLQNRRHRINYYAVCGILARAYIYANNYTEAYSNAKEVIDAEKFPWVDIDIFLEADQNRDRIMYPEVIFGWYAESRKSNLDSRYQNTITGYFIHGDHLGIIYETATSGADDIRYKGWFVQTANDYKITKYLRNSTDEGDKHYLIIPAIRLSELYYIAAEAIFKTTPDEAWSLLNEVRSHRAIRNRLSGNEDFTTELLKEYRKETYAEGQAFYAYKRLEKNIVAESGAPYLPEDIAPIPLPDVEIEFGNRK